MKKKELACTLSFHNYDSLINIMNACCTFITKHSLRLPFHEKQDCLLGTVREINSTVHYGHCDPVRLVNCPLRFRVRFPLRIDRRL